uniref:LCN-type CS-alpha/beta domain-containing protein n=1 Tax=Strigamia maritima TaxID=126957 RepID=T1IU72_STRMM
MTVRMKLCLLLFILVVAFAFNEALAPHCRWDGTAPFCAGLCLYDEVTCEYDKYGDGKKCWTDNKVLCCESWHTCEAARNNLD